VNHEQTLDMGRKEKSGSTSVSAPPVDQYRKQIGWLSLFSPGGILHEFCNHFIL